ncbi:hydratase [Oscillospiraceae bacterium OttesenSCG-928-F05]|nr:hydratase [Oscillospiraceae bacterium OttesenSCG-928-F05]
MVVTETGSYRLSGGALAKAEACPEGRRKTMAAKILSAHNISKDEGHLRLKVDAMASHDITYVGIVQTARASGLEKFPIPYVLTNCHNSLCAVGGTINEDDHAFGLSAARKYGGEFVPAHLAVIHQYMRERYAAPGRMILASDSHTRYGPVGTLSVGEGGPELVKQLLGRTYDIADPDVVAVWLEGKPRPGVGPQDVALALIRATFESGFVKNKVLEFIGPGIEVLSMDYRFGIDVMTTETTCLSSVWQTDDTVKQFMACHGRGDEYTPIAPEEGTVYDGLVKIDLGKIEPMIALPFHPSNAYTIREFLAHMDDILAACDREGAAILGGKKAPSLREKISGGDFYVDQAFVGGCSGGLYENILRMADILRGSDLGSGAFQLSVYPSSQPLMLKLMENGALSTLMAAGATVRTAFCGPCFGAGDVPANGGFSIRHATRNFPNREGAKPGDGQLAYVALMDARSIAATALNGGKLTPADALEHPPADGTDTDYTYNDAPYRHRVYFGAGKARPEEALVFGPNIADWPEMPRLPENLVLGVASAIYDPVTTTDELIPSGETSSYRSNPMKLASFALSRKDPGYVDRAKALQALEAKRRGGGKDADLGAFLRGCDPENTGIGSVVFALKPGDGSAREQAASCQRVLGGAANIAGDYATKRYRSNVINWGMLPFVLDGAAESGIAVGDILVIKGIRKALESGAEAVEAQLWGDGRAITLKLPGLTRDERDVILAGCLINYYRAQ